MTPPARTPSAIYGAAVRGAHRAYKLTLSPLIGQQCRFLPTCSDYARDVLLDHGPIKGGWLTARRLCKCHPFGGSGYDPSPGRAPIRSKTTSPQTNQPKTTDR